MSMQEIKIGSRGSPLAIVQVKEILSTLKKAKISAVFTHRVFETRGDLDKKTALTAGVQDDFFTDTLDGAVLAKEIDVSVHSAKDLPQNLKSGLSIFALTAAIDETDAFVGPVDFFKLKKHAKVGTSSFLRRDFLKNLNPNIDTVNIRGNIGERIKMVTDGQLDGVIVATCALKRLKLSRHIKNILPYETTPLQGQLAVVGREDDGELRKLFEPLDVRKKYGKVFLVGAGPGDPQLITLKGVAILKKADVVFYDYLTDKSLLGYAKNAEKIYAGRRKGEHVLPQSELLRLIREKVVQGKNVVRLKGGDPLIFGRGADEISYLRAYHIDVEIVPGVSSATGIPSSLSIPLTARGISSSVAFISGHSEDESKARPQSVKIPQVDTIVFLMGLTKLKFVVKALRKQRWDMETPVMIVSRGTHKDERIILGTVADIEKIANREKPQQPALIIVGKTIRFWQKSRQEKVNPGTLYLGTNPEKYRKIKNLIHWPMIELQPIKFSQQQRKQIVENLNRCDLIILTSRFSVKYFFECLKSNKYPLSRLNRLDVVVIGKDTAQALKKYKITPKLVSPVETSQGFLAFLKEHYSFKNKKILFPRSHLPNPHLKQGLTKCGAKVFELSIYKNIKPPQKKLPQKPIDRVLFTSPSTVKNFLKDYRRIPKDWKILSKGPATSRALRMAGYESEVLSSDEIS